MVNVFFYTPKYVQIQDYLIDWIETNRLAPGDLIPTERELSEKFGVSRMTVRHAITSLVSKGLINRIQGKGSYVAEPKVEHDIGLLLSFTESTLSKGIKPGGKILQFTQIEADEKLARFLNLGLGKRVHHLVRLRFGNNVPMVIERCYFPVYRFPQIELYDLGNQSLYHIWKDVYGTSFGRMRQTLEPVAADEFEAQVLEVPIGSPVMLVERLTYDAVGTPIEYAKDIHRGDRSRFVYELPVELD
jgi:GntR family transcriptional regulator